MDDERYILIDSGYGRKLERFGKYLIDRPCAQAIWKPLFTSKWSQADAYFTREGSCKWICKEPLDNQWIVKHAGIKFILSATDFGHLGFFPEQKELWKWLYQNIKKDQNILNLFAYSGGATLIAAKAMAKVCHLDASKGMVAWAQKNAELNNLQKASIRWIVDDVMKFLKREVRRKHYYDGIILDPPTFGRGNCGEVFKIDKHICKLLSLCRDLLSDKPLFVLLTSHTLGYSPIVLHHLLIQMMNGLNGHIESGEMLLKGFQDVLPVPSGSFARWSI